MIQNEIDTINNQLEMYTQQLFDADTKDTAIAHIFSILKNRGIDVPLSYSNLEDENVFKIILPDTDQTFYFYLIVDSVEDKYDIFASILTISQYAGMDNLIDQPQEVIDDITNWVLGGSLQDRVKRSG